MSLKTLWEAAAVGDVNRIRHLITVAGTNPLAFDLYHPKRFTPLHFAAHEGQIEAARLLVSVFNVPVDIRNNGGWSPLYAAIRNGQMAVAKVLIDELSADVHTQNNNHATLLHAAASGGHIEAVDFLIKDHQFPTDVQDSLGMTPLHCAAFYGNVDVLKHFIEAHNCSPRTTTADEAEDAVGSDSNNRGEYPGCTTCLHHAVRNAHLDCCQFLLEGCANNNVALFPMMLCDPVFDYDEQGVPPLLGALGKDYRLQVDTSAETDMKRRNLNVCKYLFRARGCRHALEKPIYYGGKNGPTYLRYSVEHGYADTAIFLIAQYFWERNSSRSTDQQLSICNCKTNPSEDFTVDPDGFGDFPMDEPIDEDGLSALLVACRGANFELVRKLVRLGANVNVVPLVAVDPDHTKPTGPIAVGEVEVGEIFNEVADTNDVKNPSGEEPEDFSGWTPLHFAVAVIGACCRDDGSVPEDDCVFYIPDALEAVKDLVDAGANPNQINGKGETPLDLALRYLLDYCQWFDEMDVEVLVEFHRVVAELLSLLLAVGGTCQVLKFEADEAKGGGATATDLLSLTIPSSVYQWEESPVSALLNAYLGSLCAVV